jgi:hypothetical protein
MVNVPPYLAPVAGGGVVVGFVVGVVAGAVGEVAVGVDEGTTVFEGVGVGVVSDLPHPINSDPRRITQITTNISFFNPDLLIIE